MKERRRPGAYLHACTPHNRGAVRPASPAPSPALAAQQRGVTYPLLRWRALSLHAGRTAAHRTGCAGAEQLQAAAAARGRRNGRHMLHSRTLRSSGSWRGAYRAQRSRSSCGVGRAQRCELLRHTVTLRKRQVSGGTNPEAHDGAHLCRGRPQDHRASHAARRDQALRPKLGAKRRADELGNAWLATKRSAPRSELSLCPFGEAVAVGVALRHNVQNKVLAPGLVRRKAVHRELKVTSPYRIRTFARAPGALRGAFAAACCGVHAVQLCAGTTRARGARYPSRESPDPQSASRNVSARRPLSGLLRASCTPLARAVSPHGGGAPAAAAAVRPPGRPRLIYPSRRLCGVCRRC